MEHESRSPVSSPNSRRAQPGLLWGPSVKLLASMHHLIGGPAATLGGKLSSGPGSHFLMIGVLRQAFFNSPAFIFKHFSIVASQAKLSVGPVFEYPLSPAGKCQ